LITQAVSWHWIFFVNVPFGLATAILAARLVASDRGIGLTKGADVIGAVTVTSALMLAVYAIVQSSVYGLLSGRTAGLGGIALLLLVAFIIRESRAASPILPLRLFRSRKLSAANVIQGLMSASFLGFFFIGSLDLERVLNYGPMAIGLAFLPVAVVMGLFSVRLSATLINRFGPLAVLCAGQLVIAAALILLAVGPTDAVYAIHLLVPLALLGLGGGLSFPSLTIIAMADAAPADAGLASGILNTTGQVGGSLGLAVLATLAGTRAGQLIAGGTITRVAVADGFHLAWMVGAGVVTVTLVVSLLVLRPASRVPQSVESEFADREREAVA
jgi:MFS family permease